jgi:murein DD-endopeptidase MepM/ murein hydrolase activator NlpD
MRNWWTTVGAVALCAAMAPQAWAATHHARSHAAHPAKSSLRGQQKARADEKDRPSKASSRREATETVVASGTLPDARGKVSEITPPPEKVERGDTLYAISRRTGVSVEELAELNKLRKPYPLRAGQSLKLPRTRAYTVHSGDTLSGVAARFGLDTDVLAAFNSFSAEATIRAGQKIDLPPNAEDKAAKVKAKPAPKPRPPAPRPAPPVSRPAPQHAAPPPEPRTPPPPAAEAPEPEAPPPARPAPPPETGSYPGATALPPARPAQAPPSRPQPQPQPQRPTLEPERPQASPPQAESPSGFQVIPAPEPQQPNPRPTYGSRPTPQHTPSPAPNRPPSRAIIQTNPAPSQGQVAAAGRGRFIWPVHGNVLSPFGLKPNGTKNDGMNIQVQTGEPVRAAAAGEVVYAGDQVPSFGNLVLIKHAGGWVTAYANLGRITVSNREQVTQGQQVGIGGQSGAVDSPQVHFEVRYAASAQDKALPVDPALVLPER